MPRNVTLCSGQWADLPLEELCPLAKSLGYDGLELACWGDHFNIEEAAKSKAYCDDKRRLLEKHGLSAWAISNHLAGQLTCDPNDDARSDGFCMDKSRWGDAEKKRQWGIDQMLLSADAARNFGVEVVNGFMGSPIWHLWYSFPPVVPGQIDAGFARVREIWTPILERFAKNGVRFALEVHPTEIAFDLWSFERLILEFDGDPTLGCNFDPSHLLWQGVDPARFLRRFVDRCYHVHVKDVAVRRNPDAGILGSHLDFGDIRRGWDFKSPGRGNVDFNSLIEILNAGGYDGPLSVEWGDAGMDREFGAREACAFVRELDYPPSALAFDGQFAAK